MNRCRITLAVLVVLALACLGGAFKASAQPAPGLYCFEWKLVKERFAEKYGEVPVSGGRTKDGQAVIVLASPAGKSFTILLLDKAGRACLLGGGIDWKPGELPKLEKAT